MVGQVQLKFLKTSRSPILPFLLPNCVSHPRCSPCQDSPPGGRERCTRVQGQQPLHPRGPSSRGDLLLGPEGLPLRRYHHQEAGVVMEASRMSSSQDESSLLPSVPPRSHDLGVPAEALRSSLCLLWFIYAHHKRSSH